MKPLTGILLFLILWSCKQDEIAVQPSGREYGAAAVGSVQFYRFTEIEYNYTELEYQIIDDSVVYLSGIDTTIYYVKDSTASMFEDLEGDSVYRIERYYSDQDGQWASFPDSVWTQKYHNNQFLRTENNVTYAKLAYPLSLTTEWDINAHNTREKDEVTYVSLRSTEEVAGTEYSSVLVVEHENIDDDPNDNLPQDRIDVRMEYWVPKIGMIKRVSRQLINCQNDGKFCHPNLFIINEGQIITQELTLFR